MTVIINTETNYQIELFCVYGRNDIIIANFKLTLLVALQTYRPWSTTCQLKDHMWVGQDNLFIASVNYLMWSESSSFVANCVPITTGILYTTTIRKLRYCYLPVMSQLCSIPT